MKFFWLLTIGLLVLIVAAELLLRFMFGFGDPLLYEADAKTGYRLVPNQSVRRFGNRIKINAYSMRSDDISRDRPADTTRILLLGDSVVNGGWWTDQSQTVSQLLQNQLQAANSKARDKNAIEVLNASANSWSPRSEVGYLEQFGLFGSQYLILVINTDDLFATAPTSLVVGQDRNYPDRKPWGAIAEVIERYALPTPKPTAALKLIQAEKGDRVGASLAAIGQIQTLAQASGTKMLLILTPLLREVKDGPRDYELTARDRLATWVKQENLDYIDCLPIFQSTPDVQALYHDHIHLSAIGNQQISEPIQRWLTQ
jgi:hypothetical protein